MLGVLESEFVCNLAHCLVAAGNHLLGCVYQPCLYIFLCSLAGLLFYEVSEIVRGEEYLVCKIFYGGKSVCPCPSVVEIVVEQRFESAQYILVYDCTRVELAFIGYFRR